MTLLVSGLSIYLVNRNEIIFNLTDVVFPLIGLFLVISVILYLILRYIRRFDTAFDIFAGILAGLTLAVWIQSQLLVWNFGQFNGQRIPWDKFKINMYIDGIVWVLIIGGSVFGFIKGKQNFKKALVAGVYILGSISVLISFLNAPPRFVKNLDTQEYKDIFTFHPENNVLVIVLDEFQSDYFGFIADKYPQEVRELDGFIFYRNTISRFPTTRASLPSILTGTLYRNEKSYYDYITESSEKFNLIQAYKNKSYSTTFAGHMGSVFSDFIPMEKVTDRRNTIYFHPVLEYLDYSAFRAFPTFLKPVIFNNGNWFFTFIFRKEYPPKQYGADIRFLELLEKYASINSDKKGSFKFLHFFIPHAPWCVNENLKFDTTLFGDTGYLNQARGAIKLASRILITLKRIGIYDNSEIVIMSDHGTGVVRAIDRGNIYNDAISLISPSVQSSSLALLLHKPVNSKGKIVTSDIPLEVSDLACLLGVRNDDTACHDFILANSGGKRQRTFYNYIWSQEYWNDYFFPPITEYIVSGPAYNPESYSLGKFIYTSKGIESTIDPSPATYKLGKVITFSLDGHGEAIPYLKAGWSTAESYHLWSDGPMSGLSFHLEKAPEKDILLRFLGFGYVPPNKNRGQSVSVIVNQAPIDRWLIKDNKWYEAVIPREIITDNTVNIVFDISDPLSPGDFKNAKDKRRVGIAIRKMVLEEIK